MARQIVVILIHGIRTEAWWQDRVASILSRDTGATVIPLKYGYFDLLRFWCPLGICRNGPIERLRKQIEGVRQSYKDCRLVVFAHSFGTYALAQILLDNPYFTFDQIVLCGSIVRENFDWRRVENQIISDEKRNAIINDCGTRDVWPVLAKSASWDYGASGTLGFGSFNVKDRFHPFRHSDFFATKFVRDYWVPAVIGKPIEDARVDAKDVGTPAWFGLLRFPLRWIIAVGIPLLAVLAALPPLLQLLDPVQIMNTPSGVSLIDPTQDTKDVAEFEFEPLPGSSIQFRLKGTYSVRNRTVSGVMTDGYFQTTEQFAPLFQATLTRLVFRSCYIHTVARRDQKDIFPVIGKASNSSDLNIKLEKNKSYQLPGFSFTFELPPEAQPKRTWLCAAMENDMGGYVPAQ